MPRAGRRQACRRYARDCKRCREWTRRLRSGPHGLDVIAGGGLAARTRRQSDPEGAEGFPAVRARPTAPQSPLLLLVFAAAAEVVTGEWLDAVRWECCQFLPGAELKSMRPVPTCGAEGSSSSGRGRVQRVSMRGSPSSCVDPAVRAAPDSTPARRPPTRRRRRRCST